MSTNAPLKRGTIVNVTPKENWPPNEFQGIVHAYIVEKNMYVVIDQDADAWDVDPDQLEVVPPDTGKIVYLENPNSDNPMCKCSVCGHTARLMDGFNLLAAGMNGIRKRATQRTLTSRSVVSVEPTLSGMMTHTL